jgi:hypothetical protein
MAATTKKVIFEVNKIFEKVFFLKKEEVNFGDYKLDKRKAGSLDEKNGDY